MKSTRKNMMAAAMLIVGLCAPCLGAADQPKPAPLRWRGFREARFLREVSQRKDHAEGFTPLDEPPILILRFEGEASQWQRYGVTEARPTAESSPPRREPTYAAEISAMGNPAMFGVVTELGESDIAFPVNGFMRSFSSVPVLPPGTLTEGDDWRIKVPPIPMGRNETREPRLQYSWLQQHWTDTPTIDGYRCARIEYSICETAEATAELRDIYRNANSAEVEIAGEVYFAIEEGIPVLEFCTLSEKVIDAEGKLLHFEQMRKHLLLVSRTPFPQGHARPMPKWNPTYQLGQQETMPARAQPSSGNE